MPSLKMMTVNKELEKFFVIPLKKYGIASLLMPSLNGRQLFNGSTILIPNIYGIAQVKMLINKCFLLSVIMILKYFLRNLSTKLFRYYLFKKKSLGHLYMFCLSATSKTAGKKSENHPFRT